MATVEFPRAYREAPPADKAPGLGAGIEDTQRALRDATHLPGYIYTSPELFALEKEKIFMKDWLAVARVEELPDVGDFMTFDVMGEPLVVARNRQGELNAFVNSCVHRGVEVVGGRGNAKQFKCPYHAWTYDLDGKLMGAAYMDDVHGFDADTCRMPKLRLEIWEGWVFVTFDQNAAPLSEFVADYASEFGVFQQGRYKMTVRLDDVLNCNWKLINENFVDIYHILTLHSQTLMNWPRPESYPYKPMKNGGYAAFYENTMPSLSGLKELGAPPWLDKWMEGRNPQLIGGQGFLGPAMTTFCRAHSMAQIILWPLTPDTTRVVQYLTVPEQFHALPDIQERAKPIHDLMVAILEEDKPMIESLQRMAHTRSFKPGRLSTGEFLVHNYMTAYLERMFGED